MMKLRSVLLSIMGWLFALVFVVLLILVIVNFIDDDLNPEIQAILDEKPAQIAKGENGYFAWIGMAGPENEAPQAWGERLFQEVLATDKKALETQKAVELSLYKSKRQETLKRDKIPCHKIETCLQAVAADPKAAEEAMQQGRVTLARGDEALRFAAYQEAWRPQASLHSAMINNHFTLWTPLAATRFALKAEKGEQDEALADLGREIAFHTRQIQGAHTLIETLVAQNNLLTRYQLLSQYLAHHPQPAKARAEKIAMLLAPFPADAASLKPAMRSEVRVISRSLLHLKVVPIDFYSGQFPELLLRPFYLPKATINQIYQWQKVLMDADDKSGDEYRRQLAEYRKLLGDNNEQIPFAVRNPVGHILNRIAMPDFGRYFLRRDNLLAMRALVAFQLDLLKSGTSQPEAIGKAIENAKLIHPHTGDKAKWDAEKRTIGYSDLPEGKELVIHIGKL
ncbi:MAG: hypothetical protein BWY57_01631 [Betaproteobacteria bacterium ADurb.Bin341]|nr:MAG: hypothetical protein BWY57_01631 [Betaproteobacteria bacterium ADurb.Bin341]